MKLFEEKIGESLQPCGRSIFLRQDIKKMKHKKTKSDKLDFINPAHGHILLMISSNTSLLIYYLLFSVDCKFHKEMDQIPFINYVSKAYCTLPVSKKALNKHFLNK